MRTGPQQKNERPDLEEGQDEPRPPDLYSQNREEEREREQRGSKTNEKTNTESNDPGGKNLIMSNRGGKWKKA